MVDFSWRQRVEDALASLPPLADEEVIAAALADAFGATSFEVFTTDPGSDRRSCLVLLRGDPFEVARLRFRRRREVPAALDLQFVAKLVRRWRDQQLQEEAQQQAAESEAEVLDLRGELREVTEVADTERRTREWLERSLLPEALLQVPGLEISSRYLPGASTTDLAGGDFYDAIARGDEVTLIIGDVQGKGLEAATLTSLARHTLRSSALRGLTPAAVLRELNGALLYGQAEQQASGADVMPRFVTAAAATFTPTDSGFKVVVARAGHPPPVIVRSDGDIAIVEPRGMLLGVFDDPDIEEATVTLAHADTVLLYTDGVTEHRAPGTQFDEHQLGLLVRNRRDTSRAESIAQLVLDTVLLLAPAAQRDDIALLVASVTKG